MPFKINPLQLLFGNPEDYTLEDQIPIVLSFATAMLSLVATTVNIILGFSLILILIPLSSGLAMFFVYYKLRYSPHKYVYKILMAAVAFIYFNFLWYNNYASYGPGLYLFLLFFIFLIMIFDGKTRLILSSLLLLNIAVFFVVEYFATDLIVKYSDNNTRIFDIYITFFIYLAFTSVMSMVIRYYYRLERTKAEKSDQLKSAFLSNMSHEIRTPMNAILGFSKLIEFAESERERHEYVSIINANGKILMDLIDDILDMSKLDAGQFDVYLKPFVINTVMKELGQVIRLNLDQQEKPDVLLTLIAEPGTTTIYSDENRLKQVLYNFLTNASKFTINGEISYGYRLSGKDIEFFVSDTGIGIREEHFKDIFNRFFKIDNSEYTTLPRGSGIGLSISRMIVEKLGGNIAFASEYRKGSTFSFVLPSVVVDSVQVTLPETTPKAVLHNLADMNLDGTVLITEDDASNMMLITNLLRKLGVSYLTAGNGSDALNVFDQNPGISLVLMDINLPLMNGYEALKAFKKINPELPVVALTAHAMQSDKDKALAEGFNWYLSKPVEQSLLADCLQKYLSTKTVAAKLPES